MSLWEIDWKDLRGVIAGGTAMAFLGYIGLAIAEWRRRICVSTSKVYFGPTLSYNGFMGRNYPSDDSISFDCTIRFFSNKSLQTGLHNFRLEFCRSTYVGPVVELALHEEDIYRDLFHKDKPHSLAEIELPSRTFVSFDIMTMIGRESWPALRPCDVVLLTCETPEGKAKRFPLARIRFPKMPPEMPRGIEQMSVYLMPKDGRFMIVTQRRSAVLVRRTVKCSGIRSVESNSGIRRG
jgi:hypothetical protein